LLLLTWAQEPLSAARVCRDLERRDLGIYAEITVKRSLAKLKRWGQLGTRRRAPRGYYLPDNLPLFRHLCRGCSALPPPAALPAHAGTPTANGRGHRPPRSTGQKCPPVSGEPQNGDRGTLALLPVHGEQCHGRGR
jgi:hypothetical protein